MFIPIVICGATLYVYVLYKCYFSQTVRTLKFADECNSHGSGYLGSLDNLDNVEGKNDKKRKYAIHIKHEPLNLINEVEMDDL
jgi:hypothetical protein